jgi:GcrA cell cycle regulator
MRRVSEVKVDWASLEPLLIELWDDLSVTAKEIAKRLGPSVTKNSVIGKAHRLGLPTRPTGWLGKTVVRPPKGKQALPEGTHPKRVERPTKHDAKKPKIAKSPAVAPPPPDPPPPPPQPQPSPKAQYEYTILDLTSHTCRWPIGQQPPYMYCGLKPFDELPYCEYHSRVAFTGTRAKQAVIKPWR